MFSPPRSPQWPAPCTSAVFSPRSSPNVLCVRKLSNNNFSLAFSASFLEIFLFVGRSKWSGVREARFRRPFFCSSDSHHPTAKAMNTWSIAGHRPEHDSSRDARTTHQIATSFSHPQHVSTVHASVGQTRWSLGSKKPHHRDPGTRYRCCWCRGELRRGEERVLWSMRKIFQVRFHSPSL